MESIYKPLKTKVIENKKLSPDTNLLTMKIQESGFNLDFTPGQFIELSIAGYGEIPVGIASKPGNDLIQATIREVGNVSRNIPRLEKGDIVGIRGPFGNGFLPEWIDGKSLMIIGGGCGIPPLRSLLLHALENKKKFKNVTFCYGARTKEFLLFRDEYLDWADEANLKITVDTDKQGWDVESGVSCNVGVVTNILSEELVKKDTVACLCGPPIMYRFVVKKLIELGVTEDRILVSLERRMKCGIGKCQHCNVAGKYVCMDGPVFPYSEAKKMWGAME